MEATLLIPNFLYLGSEFNAANRELLIEYNISAIVNAAAPQTANHFIQESSCYRYHSIDLLDAAEEDLLKHIEPYSRFLDEAERKGEVALVHCKSGNSRAAALCIAHLMRRHRWPLAKAFAFVKMKRPAAQPNKGFLEQLAIYQRYLQEEEEQAEQEENDHDDDDKDQDGDEGAQEEEDAMELELARRRAAFMRRYAGGGEDDSSDEGEGEEYEMDLDDDQEPLVKGKEKQQPAAVANTNEDLNWEKQRKDEEEDDEEEEREEREEEARRAKAKRDWQRWFAKPPALVDLVVRHRRAALAHRVSALFAAGNWEELKRVYASLRDTPEFVNIVRAAYFAATKADAVAAAAAIVAAQTATGEEAKLDAVVDWRRIQQERLVSTFGTAPEPGFQRAFEQTLPYFLNPLAKTIVAHLDRTLKSAGERSPKEVEDELWPLLESSLPYMGRNAAAFEFHFANALAGRLLSIGPGQNHRFHVERAVAQLVGRFQSFSGFGALMEAMVSDAQFSFEMEEMQKSAAKDKVRQGEESGALVSVRLLAADLWPRRRILPPASKDLTDADMRSWRGVPLANWPKSYVLPSSVQQKWDAFAAAYLAENPQRRLQYIPHMGTAEMQVVLGESRYFFTVTTAMMCVLHRFAFGQEFSLRELQDETAIPDKDLKRTLFSLISPLQGSRVGLLVKQPVKGKFEPTDRFSVNAAFASRLRKIRVPALPYPPPRKQRQPTSSSSSSSSTGGAMME